MPRRSKQHRIMALDLARTTGWALGPPGRAPRSGVITFGGDGASHEARFLQAHAWARSMIDLHKPTTVVWEEPLPSSFLRGRTNSNTTALLCGLPAVIGLACYQCGLYDVRRASPSDIRCHFIGRNMRSKEAEAATKLRCRQLGWAYSDDNEADALALWDYMVSILAPDQSSAPALPGIIKPQRVSA